MGTDMEFDVNKREVESVDLLDLDCRLFKIFYNPCFQNSSNPKDQNIKMFEWKMDHWMFACFFFPFHFLHTSSYRSFLWTTVQIKKFRCGYRVPLGFLSLPMVCYLNL